MDNHTEPIEANTRTRRLAERIFYVLFAASFLGAFALSLTGHNRNGLGTFSEEGISQIKAAAQSICAELDRIRVGRCGAITWQGKHGVYARIEVHAQGNSLQTFSDVMSDLGWAQIGTGSGSIHHTKDALNLSLSVSPAGSTYLIISSTK
ncbi:MAG: hypothetical protein SF172_16240 [Burkholderiales bacterium]|nr:hypothetical protein [Burkholderiales bacterium]